METQSELARKLVLVHPKLAFDPAQRKNQIGWIAQPDIENDNFLVCFSDKGLDRFSADALLVLKDAAEIKKYADWDASLLFYEDYQDLLQVIWWAEIPDNQPQWLAIELARKNPMVFEYSMTSLKDNLSLYRDNGFGR